MDAGADATMLKMNLNYLSLHWNDRTWRRKMSTWMKDNDVREHNINDKYLFIKRNLPREVLYLYEVNNGLYILLDFAFY